LSSMSQVIALSILGAVIFGERLAAPKLAGLGLAIASIWLFSQTR